MKNQEELRKQIKELISNARTGEAIERLREQQLPDLEVKVINISARYAKLKNQEDLQVITEEYAKITMNQINQDLLELVNELGHVAKGETASDREEKNTTPAWNEKEKATPIGARAKKSSASGNVPASDGISKKYLSIAGGILLAGLAIGWGVMQSGKKPEDKKVNTEMAANGAQEPAKQAQETAKQVEEKKQAKENNFSDKLAEYQSEKVKIAVGKDYRGGIIYYVEESESGIKCLIAAKGDHPETEGHKVVIPWQEGAGKIVKAQAYDSGLFQGKGNTEVLAQKFNEGKHPAKLCADFSVGDNKDWHLPSKEELIEFWKYVQKPDSWFYKKVDNQYYWSSTEVPNADVFYKSFHNGKEFEWGKGNKAKVRPVSMFELKAPVKE
jgi:Effector-associated domain 11/Protein of unknown function (DUF1566)